MLYLVTDCLSLQTEQIALEWNIKKHKGHVHRKQYECLVKVDISTFAINPLYS